MDQHNYRYIGKNRRTVEDRRFVAGQAKFVSDIRVPGLKHVSVVSSPYPAAKIINIDDRAARAMDGVFDIVTGADYAAATNSLPISVDAPAVKRWPLAVDQVRYAGEWVVAVVADSRARAEDAAESIDITYEPLEFVTDPEEAFKANSPPVHADHGSNIMLHRNFTWGEVEQDFEKADNTLSYRVRWGRSSTVP